MSADKIQAQRIVQAGSPGKAATVGLEVGVLHSSDETPVTGAERRRDTCPDVRSDRDRWPRKGISLYDAHVINPDFSLGGKPRGRTGLGKPDTGNPSVRFDEGSESDGHWLCLSPRRLRPTLRRGFAWERGSESGQLQRSAMFIATGQSRRTISSVGAAW